MSGQPRLLIRAARLEIGAGTRVDERPPVARHPPAQPLAVAHRQPLEQLRIDARGKPAMQRVGRLGVQEERAGRERHELGELRRNHRHRVRDAEARAHRLRNLIERVDLAVRERDVLEDRRRRVGRGGRHAGGCGHDGHRQLRHVDVQLLNFGAQLGENAEERLDDLWIERLAGLLLQQRDSFCGVTAGASSASFGADSSPLRSDALSAGSSPSLASLATVFTRCSNGSNTSSPKRSMPR